MNRYPLIVFLKKTAPELPRLFKYSLSPYNPAIGKKLPGLIKRRKKIHINLPQSFN